MITKSPELKDLKLTAFFLVAAQPCCRVPPVDLASVKKTASRVRWELGSRLSSTPSLLNIPNQTT